MSKKTTAELEAEYQDLSAQATAMASAFKKREKDIIAQAKATIAAGPPGFAELREKKRAAFNAWQKALAEDQGEAVAAEALDLAQTPTVEPTPAAEPAQLEGTTAPEAAPAATADPAPAPAADPAPTPETPAIAPTQNRGNRRGR